MARSVSAASSISFNQPSPAAIAVYSHVRHQPSQNAEAQSTSILNRAKHEILRIIDLMVEKTQQEVVDLLTDVCTTFLFSRITIHISFFSEGFTGFICLTDTVH